MTYIVGLAVTENGHKLISKLCKHWSHRFEVDFKNGIGRVSFPNDETIVLESTNAALVATVTSPEERFDALRTVVVDHLQRFSRSETLSFVWHTEELTEGPEHRVIKASN
jgi:hypothetical protein